MALARSAKVYVAGHRGLAGSAIIRSLSASGFSNLVTRTSAELDLRDRTATLAFLRAERPEVLVLAAARVGGIFANAARPVDFLSDNLRIQVNVLDAAHENGVGRLLFLGSSCVYPKHAPQPIRENSLLTGSLEPTNDAYAIAKIAGILHVQALRRQYGLHYITAMPSNLYGPGDNFDVATGHVLPALIHRFHDAVQQGAANVRLAGNGSACREFLHADDLASACLTLLDHYDDDAPVNVGTGTDLTIRSLARLIADVVGFTGAVTWDSSQPNGTPRKLLDTTRITALGWRPHIDLRTGIAATYDWYRRHHDNYL